MPASVRSRREGPVGGGGGAPGIRALEATLYPPETEYLYFVAHPDGQHVFSRTLEEHNRAVARMRPEWDRYRREQAQGSGSGSESGSGSGSGPGTSDGDRDRDEGEAR